jgi:head-tail adaptor
MARSPIAAGRRAYLRFRVDVPAAPPDPDDEGTYTESFVPSGPDWYAALDPQTADERLAPAGVVVADAVVIITGPYRPDVTIRARLFRYDTGATLGIRGVVSPDGRQFELIATCTEGDPNGE